MSETEYSCLFDTDHKCVALGLIKKEFEGPEHRSLVYQHILPEYCNTCPHLEKLKTGIWEEKPDNVEA